MGHRSLNRKRQREFERMREALLFQGEQEDTAERVAMSRVSRDMPAGSVNPLTMVARIRGDLNGGQPARSLRSVGSPDARTDTRSGRPATSRPGTSGPGRPRRVTISGARRPAQTHPA